MRLKEYDYFLPKELIAQVPMGRRDGSRLMVIDRRSRKIEHTCFQQLPLYIQAGDLLVANNTRVIPARIYGKKETGGRVELLLLNHLKTIPGKSQIWEGLLKSGRKIDAGSRLYFSPQLNADVLQPMGDGTWSVQLNYQGNFDEILHKVARIPLPQYIKRDRDGPEDPQDRERYQTVYAKEEGAAAAPTAGLHFTPSLMEKIKGRGADFAFLTLHVGYGTFQPIRTENITDHKMHKEFFHVAKNASESINRARSKGGRIIAVGTTATRALETMARADGSLQPGKGLTDLYIYPGYAFKSIDALITNFHLPMSSLLLLVSAFAGKDYILKAYKEAVKRKYRFFSYGDAMLII